MEQKEKTRFMEKWIDSSPGQRLGPHGIICKAIIGRKTDSALSLTLLPGLDTM